MTGTEMTIRGRGRGQGSHTLSQLKPIQCHVGPSELDPILQSQGIIVESTLNFCMYLSESNNHLYVKRIKFCYVFNNIYLHEKKMTIHFV